MLKAKWVRPEVTGQVFEANEYVAACLEGTIQCMYPGDSSTGQDDGTKTYVDKYGMWHGLCGNDAPITFSENLGKGYEVVNGKIDRTRRIYNISGYGSTPATGTYHVTWGSTDGAGTYHHEGRFVISNIDDRHPNHS